MKGCGVVLIVLALIAVLFMMSGPAAQAEKNAQDAERAGFTIGSQYNGPVLGCYLAPGYGWYAKTVTDQVNGLKQYSYYASFLYTGKPCGNAYWGPSDWPNTSVGWVTDKPVIELGFLIFF